MIIRLPWPPKQLSPNARVHHHEKARHAKVYRELAYWTCFGKQLALPDGEVMIAITFHPPDKRRRDLDSMFTSIKNGLDGIADALCVNDYIFAFTLKRDEPVSDGAVIIKVKEYKERHEN